MEENLHTIHQRSKSEPPINKIPCHESQGERGKLILNQHFSQPMEKCLVNDPSSSKSERRDAFHSVCRDRDYEKAIKSNFQEDLLANRIQLRRTRSNSSASQKKNAKQDLRARSVDLDFIRTDSSKKAILSDCVTEAQNVAGPSISSQNHNETNTAKDPINEDHAALLQFAFSPPKRSFRQRKPAQLAPYTTEMERYKRRLVRNDWEDAVVVNRELLRAAREKRAERIRGEHLLTSPQMDEEKSRQEKKNMEQHSMTTSNKNASNINRRRRKPLNSTDQNKINQEDGKSPLEELAEIQDEIIPDFATTPTTDSQSITTPFKDMSDQPRILLSKRKRYRILSESDENEDLATKNTTANDIVTDDGIEDDEIENEHPDDDVHMAEEVHSLCSSISEASCSNERQQKKSKIRDRNYASLLKMLRKTMPARMAREYIEDLKDMDQEIQLLPAEAGIQDGGSFSGDNFLTQELLPGQSKKRQRKRNELQDERFKLVGDSEDEVESSSASSVSASSQASQSLRAPSLSESSDDFDMENNIERGRMKYNKRHRSVLTNGSRSSEPPVHNTAIKSKTSTAIHQNDDMIDRMLCSSHRIQKRGHLKNRNKRSFVKRVKKRSNDPTVFEHQKAKDLSEKQKKKETSRSKNRIGKAVQNPFANVNSLSYIREARPYDKRQKIRQILQDDDIFLPFNSSLERKIASEQGKSIEHPRQAVEAWVADVDNSKGFEQITPIRTPTHPSFNDRLSAPNSFDRSTSPIEWKNKQYALGNDLERPHKESSTSRQVHLPTAHNIDLEQQRAEAEKWSSVGLARLDFDISYPDIGIRCNPEGYIGRGQLYALLHESEWHSIADLVDPSTYNSLPETESVRQNLLSVVQKYSLMDSSNYANLLRYLDDTLENYTAFARSSSSADNLNTVFDAIDQVIVFIRHEDKFKSNRDAQSIVLSKLQWYKVELLYRTIATPNGSALIEPDMRLRHKDLFQQSCQELMITLLVRGLPKTMSSIRNAASSDAGSILSIDDWSLECWVCLIHVLQSDGAQSMDTSLGNTLFWNIFESSLKTYHNALRVVKPSFVVAENAWYSIFSLCAISCVSSTTGSFTNHSALQKPNWALVLQAVSMVKIRFEERVEALMSKAAIRARDQYVHLLLRRILILTHKWKWPLENVEHLLARLFSIFNLARLQDLPSETHHDFLHSLRHFDMQILYSGAIFGDETAFQIFLRILALAVHQSRLLITSDRQGMDKLASRILSRFSPMRSLRFAQNDVPTSLERSALYNHYSIALLYLYFVPSSEQQRLLQVQQYLNIGKADQKSQIVGVRAVMYAAIILRHHDRPIDSAMKWFKSMFVHMLNLFRHLHSKLENAGETSGSSISRELGSRQTVLLTCLRALHYILQTKSIDSTKTCKPTPDISLLDPVWTNDLFDIFYLIHYPQMVLESLQLISSHFMAITSTLQSSTSNRQYSAEERSGINNESQESYSELFEDLDFDNEALLKIAGYGTEENRKTSGSDNHSLAQQRTKDLSIYENLSKALFKMINAIGMPENASSFGFTSFGDSRKNEKQSNRIVEEEQSKAKIGKTAISCWAKCATVLVDHFAIRSWDFYFRFGKEDLRFSLHINVRYEMLMYFFNALLEESWEMQKSCRSSRSREVNLIRQDEDDVYCSNLAEIWSCLLINLLEFHDGEATLKFISLVNQFEKRREENSAENGYDSLTPFDAVFDREKDFEKEKVLQDENRIEFLNRMISNLSSSVQQCAKMQKVLISTFSTIFSFVRQFLLQHSNLLKCGDDRHISRLKNYSKFLHHCQNCLDQPLARALTIDLRNTQANVQNHLDQATGIL